MCAMWSLVLDKTTILKRQLVPSKYLVKDDSLV